MMKGPLLTHVEKSSSDPRWEESMKLQLQADPSFPTNRAYTSPQGCVQLPKPACGLVLTTSSFQWVLRLCASSHVGGRAHSCQPHDTLLAAVLAASTETKLNPAALAILQGETVAIPGEWDHPVMEATHWGTSKLTPQWGPLLARSNLLSSQPFPGNQRT